MSRSVSLSLLVMAVTIYLIRVLPFLFLRKEITDIRIRSFLYYVPYVTLAVMTFPAILSATGSVWSGAAALGAAAAAALISGDLFTVAVSACAAVFLTELVLL
ncbi:AzlD domain-containing protein [Lachnoclostridium sp. Marseille-P6806]|uniref:AzlD domain-containing protein n=1 Tax=Lachnoclostridium sp. Marseille-P6806 TaxID=2364793 RepID=UPI001031C1F4|nr:AzlD domain-containing protein [Lachnoclostridium sp. Marseille-P6806]